MLQRLLITAAILLGAAPAAHAAEGVSWGHAPDGHPLLSPTTAGSSSLQWWVCPPSEQCRASARTVSPDPGYAPGDAARGTFFEVDGYVASGKVQARSPMWLGRVTARVRPQVAGTPRVGKRVRPIGAVWSGGWADDTSTLALVVCGKTCEYLGKEGALQRKHRGWSVYAVDHRTAADGPAPELKGTAPKPAASALTAVSKRYRVA